MGSPRLFVSRALVYSLLGVAVLVVVLPLVWMLGTAVKPNPQILDLRASLWPSQFQWGNIVRAWDSAPFGRWFLNSVIFSGGATIGQIVSSLMAGYAFAMYDFPAKRLLFYALLCGLMVPFSTVIVPVVQILADLHWLNTYQGLIVPNIALRTWCVLVPSVLPWPALRAQRIGPHRRRLRAAHISQGLCPSGHPDCRRFRHDLVPLQLEQLPLPSHSGQHHQHGRDQRRPIGLLRAVQRQLQTSSCRPPC